MFQFILDHLRTILFFVLLLSELAMLVYLLTHKPPLSRWAFATQALLFIAPFFLAGLFIAHVRL